MTRIEKLLDMVLQMRLLSYYREYSDREIATHANDLMSACEEAQLQTLGSDALPGAHRNYWGREK